MEFGEEDDPGAGRGGTAWVLRRGRVNVHRFTGFPAAPSESLQIRVDFSQPATRAFPVLLLVRFSERPTPADFLLKQVHFWPGLTAQVFVPAALLQGPALGYLSLLDADYDRDPPNRYLAEAVNYTVRLQGARCLLWDGRRRESESFSPQPGASAGKVSCSYSRLATFTAFAIARRSLNTSFETGDTAEFQGHPENLLPSIVIVVFTILYALLVTKSKRIDLREKKKTGYIFLQGNAPPGHQLYAVVVDTGFRAPARFTAKVCIVLCGERGLSEPRELCCPEKPLFERNSRHTFVLSFCTPSSRSSWRTSTCGPLCTAGRRAGASCTRRASVWPSPCSAPTPAWQPWSRLQDTSSSRRVSALLLSLWGPSGRASCAPSWLLRVLSSCRCSSGSARKSTDAPQHSHARP
ncbi:polycystic kidney disease protein 1-like 1 [Molossus molossus]|uniref:polycystic kidney disease protein 1-like 1 n=1 Tax=Molossus molossus TaxID=27622 RepID=UPI001746E43F|nr:polycystic kidney disease protein 1-like 1 [Molossus molossus]